MCEDIITNPPNFCRIGVDEWLRVPSVQDVFAIGDCCGFVESTGKAVLPALAQVSYKTMDNFLWLDLIIFPANCCG